MSGDRVPLEQRPGFIADVSSIPVLGDLIVDLPEGAARHRGFQCQTMTTLAAEHASGKFVILFLGKPLDPGLQGLGFYLAMEPNAARGVAEGIMRAADNLETRQ